MEIKAGTGQQAWYMAKTERRDARKRWLEMQARAEL